MGLYLAELINPVTPWVIRLPTPGAMPKLVRMAHAVVTVSSRRPQRSICDVQLRPDIAPTSRLQRAYNAPTNGEERVVSVNGPESEPAGRSQFWTTSATNKRLQMPLLIRRFRVQIPGGAPVRQVVRIRGCPRLPPRCASAIWHGTSGSCPPQAPGLARPRRWPGLSGCGRTGPSRKSGRRSPR